MVLNLWDEALHILHNWDSLKSKRSKEVDLVCSRLAKEILVIFKELGQVKYSIGRFSEEGHGEGSCKRARIESTTRKEARMFHTSVPKNGRWL